MLANPADAAGGIASNLFACVAIGVAVWCA